jgi:hypothetical protein
MIFSYRKDLAVSESAVFRLPDAPDDPETRRLLRQIAALLTGPDAAVRRRSARIPREPSAPQPPQFRSVGNSLDS